MNKTFIILLILAFAAQSCFTPGPDNVVRESAYRPIFMPRSQLEQSFALKPARTLNDPGKLYAIDNYVFINERYKGIHVINNVNPSSPQNIGFLQVPGCIDIAAKENTIYADNAVDLIAIDVSNPQAPFVSKRIKNVFPKLTPPDELPLAEEVTKEFKENNLPNDAIIVGWTKR